MVEEGKLQDALVVYIGIANLVYGLRKACEE